jgi:hypothetical protein
MDMRQVSLLALYGDKPPALAELIVACQQRLATGLGGSFRPLDVRQVHATIIGLERAGTTGSANRNMLAYRGRADAMDFAGMLGFLRGSGALPFQVQVGGFLDREYPFTSRGASPYERSFSIQEDRSVLIGWPVLTEWDARESPCAAARYPNTLHAIRQTLQRYNILHAYHRTATDMDNDFYLRIGVVAGPASRKLLGEMEHAVRCDLAQAGPVLIDVALEHIGVAAYIDDTMALSTTRYRPIAEPTLDARTVIALYDG